VVDEKVGVENIDAPDARLITANRDCEAGRLERAEICVDPCADDWRKVSVRG
jgi:hypothetical protein